MSSLMLLGRTMPVAATEGFMDSATRVLGISGATPALLLFILKELYPDNDFTSMSKTTWAALNPLYPYYRKDFGSPLAVDYFFLERFRNMLQVMYGDKGGRGLARHIGRGWWSGERPIDQWRPYKHTLLYHLSPHILDVLYVARVAGNADVQTQLQKQRTYNYESERLYSACYGFAEAILKFSGIVCNVGQGSSGITISFSQCPFCANRLKKCAIFLGVIEAFLVWLYQKPSIALLQQEGDDEHITITLNADDSHQIQIAVHKPPLRINIGS